MTEKVAEPPLAAFLALLEADLIARPTETMLALPLSMAKRLEELAAELGVEMDPDAPIEGPVSL